MVNEVVQWTEDTKWSRFMTVDAASFNQWAKDVLTPITDDMKPFSGPAELRSSGMKLGPDFIFGMITLKRQYIQTPTLFGMMGRPRKVTARLNTLGGGKQGSVEFTDDVSLPCLHNKSGPIMSMTPLEVFTLRPGFKKARGKCLVGGLGLGYFARRILERESVEAVTVIEKDPHVAQFFGDPILAKHKNVKIVVDDVWEFIRNCDISQFDSILLDVWQDAGDSFEDKNLMEVQRKHDRVWAWAEYDACLYNWR